MNRDDLLPLLITAADDTAVDLTASEALRLAAALAPNLPDLAPPSAPREPWKRWTPEDEARARSMYEAGESRAAIAEALSRSLGAINGVITRLDLHRVRS